MEDAIIVSLYWARDERAIAESAAKYGAYCQSIAQAILLRREDAEESVNDTWAGAWNSMPPNCPEHLRAFLGKITRRISMKRLRERSAEKRGGGRYELALEELAECVGSVSSAQEALERKELANCVDRFLDGLKSEERNVFVCRYWYLDSIAEISRRFGFSQSKVKSMLFRTRERLREHLRKEGYAI